MTLKVGRLTVSDRASAGIYEDRGGPELERVFGECWSGSLDWVSAIVPDEPEQVSAALRTWCDEQGCQLILTTGGTGPSLRDITPEATRAVIAREMPGFGEAQRMVSFPTVPTAILSRATAGIRGRALIINFPGNPKAISECLPPLIPAIREAIRHLQEAT
jgi:molybdopterin adenylyltransferase